MSTAAIDIPPEPLLHSRRLSFVISTLTYGGAETQVVQLAREFTRRGWRVQLISIHEPDALVEELEEAGVTVSSVGATRTYPGFSDILRLAALLREFKPDIVHSHMFGANVTTRVARLFGKLPVLVCTAHNIYEGKAKGTDIGRAEVMYRLTDRLCDLTTNVSEAAVDRYVVTKAAPANRIRCVPNGIDLTRFQPDSHARTRARQELGLANRPTLLTVGRLHRQKNYSLLLRALKSAVTNHPDALLLLVGRGPQDAELRALARQLELDNNVSFLGTRDDVPKLMNAADAYVMSSDYEGFPIVLLEASASELPVVATDISGNTDIVEAGIGGLLVPAKDESAMANALCRILSMDPDERRAMGRAARTRVEDFFSIESVVELWRSIYEELERSTRPG